MNPLIVAVTGASGVIYAVRMIQALMDLKIPVALVISEAARLVFKEEMGISLKSYTREEELISVFGEKARGLVTAYSVKDFSAPIASGSYPVQGMVVIPCSMGTLGAIASGISQNLIHRAADCIIKEGRRLILVPRETPLSAIHLENMLKLSRLGVRMVPAMPGFYSGVQSIQDLVDFMVGKILDQLEISHSLYPRWIGAVNSGKEEKVSAHDE